MISASLEGDRGHAARMRHWPVKYMALKPKTTKGEGELAVFSIRISRPEMNDKMATSSHSRSMRSVVRGDPCQGSQCRMKNAPKRLGLTSPYSGRSSAACRETHSRNSAETTTQQRPSVQLASHSTHVSMTDQAAGSLGNVMGGNAAIVAVALPPSKSLWVCARHATKMSWGFHVPVR